MALVFLGRKAYQSYKDHKDAKSQQKQASSATSWDQLQSCNETSLCAENHSTQEEHQRRSSLSSWDQLQSCNEDSLRSESHPTQHQRSSCNMDQIQTSYYNSMSPSSRSLEEAASLYANSVGYDRLAKTPSPKLPQRAPGHQYPAPPYHDANSPGEQQRMRDLGLI